MSSIDETERTEEESQEEINISQELKDIWSVFEVVREALSSNGLEIATITSILVDKGIVTEEQYSEQRIKVSKEILEYVQRKIDEEKEKNEKVVIS